MSLLGMTAAKTHCESYTLLPALFPSPYHKTTLCQWHRGELKGEMGHAGATAPAGSTKQREERTPHISVRIRAGFSVQLALSPEAARRAQPRRVQSVPARWQHRNPTPKGWGHSLPCAGTPAAMPAAMHPSPAWKGQQGSSAGGGLTHPSQPWLVAAGKSQVGSLCPHPVYFGWQWPRFRVCVVCVHFISPSCWEVPA